MGYVEKARELPIYAEVDVVVVGSGPSGMSAAIAAAREGADTLLIEQYGCFGGVLTQCGVETFSWYRYKNTEEAGGLAREYESRYKKEGGINIKGEITPKVEGEMSTGTLIDAEVFKVIADEMITEAGVKVLLHTMGVQAIMDGDTIKGVIIENKSGRQAVLAKRVIDCTGDADIAALAGVPFTKEPKDKLMGVTTTLHVKNVDVKKFKSYVENELKPTFKDWGGYWDINTTDDILKLYNSYIDKQIQEGIKEGLIPKEDDVYLGGSWSKITEEGEVTELNMVWVVNIDCTDADDLTRAEITGRRNSMYLLEVLRKKIPGFENVKLRNFSMTLGVRESRVIDGLYRLTEKDVTEQAEFDDSIAIYPEFLDGFGYLLMPTTGRHYQIPYRCMVPKKVANLLVAGRSICSDRVARVSVRNMISCVNTGQACGIAAALSINENVNVKDVNIQSLQEHLIKQNVRIK